MKKLSFLICTIILSGSISYASSLGGYDAGALNSQYMRDLRMHEMTTRAKSQSAIVKSTNKVDEAEKVPVSTNIKSISFVNNKAISSQELARITESSLNKPATESNIADLRKLILKYYQANGYYSALAFPNTNNLSSGEIIFEIQEGTKNSIVIE